MNVKLLEQVKRSILAHPKRFVMDSFIEAKKLTGDDFFFADDGTEVKFDHCGTAACIAGWTCLIKMKQKAINAELNFHVSGMGYLGLDGDEAGRLFYAESWPREFYHRYNAARTQAKRAKIAAARIDHFIATEGRE
jgi:hypothetical protein